MTIIGLATSIRRKLLELADGLADLTACCHLGEPGESRSCRLPLSAARVTVMSALVHYRPAGATDLPSPCQHEDELCLIGEIMEPLLPRDDLNALYKMSRLFYMRLLERFCVLSMAA